MKEKEYLIEISKQIINKKEIAFDERFNTDVFWELAKRHKLDWVICNNIDEAVQGFPKRNREIMHQCFAERSKAMKQVCNALNAAGIDFLIVKGVMLSYSVYQNFFFRNYGDIDVIVKKKDFEKAFYAMRDLGYRTVHDVGNDKPRFILGVFFHEIKMIKDQIKLEVKHGVSAVDTDFEPWISQTCQMQFEGMKINTLDIYHTILLLLAQAYINNEGKVIFHKCRLREYFDVAYFIINNSEFDWDKLIELSKKYQLTDQVVSVVKSVHEIFTLPEAFVDKMNRLIDLENLPYEKNIFYYGDDKKDKFNSGLLIQKFRANAEYSIFDQDFSTYQYIKNYKAVLYSKRNLEYRERCCLSAEQSTPWMDYTFNNDEIQMKYRYLMFKESFQTDIFLDKKCFDALKRKDLSVRIMWYDNDITSCMLQRYVDSGTLSMEELDTSESRVCKVITRDYYDREGIYSSEIARLGNGKKVILWIESQVGGMVLRFNFTRDFIFEVLDNIAMEVKLMLNHSSTEAMSLGAKVDIISARE